MTLQEIRELIANAHNTIYPVPQPPWPVGRTAELDQTAVNLLPQEPALMTCQRRPVRTAEDLPVLVVAGGT